MPKSFIAKLFKKFKLLKVLDFEDAPIDYLPEEVRNLFHLKYLNMRRTKVKILPNSVGSISEDEIIDLESISSPPPFLKHIYLRGRSKKLLNWILELQNLIGPCPQMKEVPYGMQHLESLKIIDFYEMQREFVLRMQPDGGEDYWKVKKVTTIHLRYWIKGERYQIYKLGDSDLLEHLQGSILEDQTTMPDPHRSSLDPHWVLARDPTWVSRAELLVQEAKLLNGVHREVVGISDDLESIMCFLKDVDARAKKGGDLQYGRKVWVKQMREVAFHIEDVLDEYILHVAQHRY
ncbi:hypothetical protein FH972_026776 [Carpinus fangiana]|uniref:Disease resistance N-terminal domain-containing protein n=1 Tax=Carpinus fangiana TaxID=176857 RepID=A0A5N6L5D5_9ROSI|nr:hypothetical protein FH972_026776 [Carpinus fangiana]